MACQIKLLTNEKLLEKIILEEEQIRMSKEYQDACTQVKNIPNGWLQVTAKMQRDLVKKHGFDDDISCNIAVNTLRRARYIYPNNPIFKTPVYVRENKARVGELKEGDSIVNVELFQLNKDKVNLQKVIAEFKSEYTVIFGGSHT
jgi:hypothetical protein